MGGSVGKLFGGSSFKAIDKLSRDPLKSMTFALDPGGVVHTSDDPDIAAYQAKLDVGGYGAKPVIAERKQLKEIAKQEGIQKKQESALAATEAERKKRQARARQGRRSLLYGEGDESGVSKTLG